jgi:hypothetical protein
MRRPRVKSVSGALTRACASLLALFGTPADGPKTRPDKRASTFGWRFTTSPWRSGASMTSESWYLVTPTCCQPSKRFKWLDRMLGVKSRPGRRRPSRLDVFVPRDVPCGATTSLVTPFSTSRIDGTTTPPSDLGCRPYVELAPEEFIALLEREDCAERQRGRCIRPCGAEGESWVRRLSRPLTPDHSPGMLSTQSKEPDCFRRDRLTSPLGSVTRKNRSPSRFTSRDSTFWNLSFS